MQTDIITYRGLRKEDVGEVRRLWDIVFADDIYPCRRPTKSIEAVFDHPGFDPQASILAVNHGMIVGFGLGMLRDRSDRIPADVPGHLLALIVHPEHQNRGIGSHMLDTIEKRFRQLDRKTITTAIGPTYFRLGVRKDGLDFDYFRHRGWNIPAEQCGVEAIWMECDVRQWQWPQSAMSLRDALSAKGIEVRMAADRDYDSLLTFMAKHFEGWSVSVRDNLKLPKPHGVAIAVQGGARVIGFTGPLSVDENRVGWVGGVGVDSEFRKHGIGRAVFNLACSHWKETGAARAYLWTNLNNPASRIYSDCGFRIVGTYVTMMKSLL